VTDLLQVFVSRKKKLRVALTSGYVVKLS